MRTIVSCGECESPFYADSSQMIDLCPECAHVLCGYEPCAHHNTPCSRCGWDGSRSRYVFGLLGLPMRSIETPDDALVLLAELGATAWLIRHHELVIEAAVALCDGLEQKVPDLVFSRQDVLLGAALHDIGKVVVPDEMSAPGHQHELAGRHLLIRHNVASDVTRFCTTHASWRTEAVNIDDLLVALADTLWKGKRDEQLESRVVDAMLQSSSRILEYPRWEAFAALDALCDEIAAAGPARLVRSNV